MNEDHEQAGSSAADAVSAEQRALDGLLREFVRNGTGIDEVFVQRVMHALPASLRPLEGSVDKLRTQETHARADERIRSGLLHSVWFRGACAAAACLVVLICLTPLLPSRGPAMMKLREREMAYQEIGYRKLGEFLAERHAGARALIITEPSLQGIEARPASVQLSGLRRGFGDKIDIVAAVSPKVPDSASSAFAAEYGSKQRGGQAGEMLPPLEFWYTAEIFDDIVARYTSECDLIVTTIGLPMQSERMRYWTMPNKPALALASGSIYELKQAIKTGTIVGAITYNPKAVYDEKAPPTDLDAAFDKRFLLVTPENVDTVARKHSDLFR